MDRVSHERTGDRAGSPVWLQIADRFRVVRTAAGVRKFVALADSLRVEVDGELETVLDIVIRRLEEGSTLEALVDAAGRDRQDTVLRIVDHLRQQGLIHESSEPGAGTAAARQFDRVSGQRRFFANFRPHSATPLAADRDERPLPSQERLAQAEVVLLGLGRLGSRLVVGLSELGIGTVWGADPRPIAKTDVIDSGFREDDVGALRMEALSRSHGRNGSEATFRPLPVPATKEDLPVTADLLVVCEDHFDPAQYRAINRLCLDRRQTWISCRNLGLHVEIGPTIVPGDTACYRCMELRRSANVGYYDDLLENHRLLAGENLSVGALNITFGYELLALEIVKILTGFSRPMTYGTLFRLDLLSMESRLHPVLKIPRCPECGSARSRPSVSCWTPDDLLGLR